MKKPKAKAPKYAYLIRTDAKYFGIHLVKSTSEACAREFRRLPWNADDKTARVERCLITVLKPKRK